jgi:hypothetical protein
MRSIAKLLGVNIMVPHFTNMSRRGNGLSLSAKAASKNANPLHLVVDSTGLKIFGEGEWLEKKHKTNCKLRSWRKLHLGLDLLSGQIGLIECRRLQHRRELVTRRPAFGARVLLPGQMR